MKSILKPGIHWLYLFLPVTVVLEVLHASAPLVFLSAALSIIPLAHLIGQSTEQIAGYTGDALGALLNVTFGNAPELIITIVALNAGLHDIVLASLAGAILANLLLATGLSFLFGGFKFHNQEYNASGLRINISMMMIATISLMIPAAFHNFSDKIGTHVDINSLNILVASILLLTYGLYLVFMLKTHPDLFAANKSKEEGESHEKRWSLLRGILSLIGASVLAAVMSEMLVGAAEETGKIIGMSNLFIGVVLLAVIGGAAETISAVAMAQKNKMDLSIGIAMGSSMQIALFVAPLLVLLSLFIGPGQMNLNFSRLLMVSIFLSVILGALVAGDGKSNWYKGIQLVIVYIIIGIMFYFIPA
ncbi:MAG: calcium/proton exchanger [Bacteroidia bacterium]|jgi:Ca2+:H+ antiporter|nr:calcium/proton exchanger [Bacteroidia bacterium]